MKYEFEIETDLNDTVCGPTAGLPAPEKGPSSITKERLKLQWEFHIKSSESPKMRLAVKSSNLSVNFLLRTTQVYKSIR